MRSHHRAGFWFLGLVAAVVLIRALLPYGVLRIVNGKLSNMGDYHGVVQDVDLHLWRGAYTLHQLNIEKNNGEVPIPLLSAPKVELSLGWRQLLRGALVGTAEFQQPDLNFVDAEASARKQVGVGVDWRQKLQDLLAIQLDEVVVRDGRVHFRNLSSTPPVDLKVTDVQIVVRNLTNSSSAIRRATFDGTAKVFDQARLDTSGEFDPIGRPDSFVFKLRVLDIDLTLANSFVRAYSGLDIASGSGDFVAEVTAEKGRISGYAKPLIKDLKVFSWAHDGDTKSTNPLRVIWQSLATVAVEVFTNRRNDQFGTRIELRGSIDDSTVNVPGALWGIVRNAFIKAYKPDFESLRDAAKPSKDSK